MPTDDDAERRSQLKTKWVKARAKARARKAPTRPQHTDPSLTRKQVAERVQKAASEALAALRLRQRNDRPSY